jgi:hypothetical protein
MENQVGDITAFLKGMQARLDDQHATLKQSLDVNTSTLRELSDWKPQVQAEVKVLQSNIASLQAKVDELSMKQEEISAHKVFDAERPDLTGSTSTPLKETSRPLGHGSAQDHRGFGNGVVTTLIPTPVTGAKDSDTLSPVPFILGSPYQVDASQYPLNHAIPPVEFPDFDGSSPKLWVKNCENYFDLYDVPDSRKSKIASMHLISNAAFWAQSLDFSLRDLPWVELSKLVCDRFEKDQHDYLLRQFFHVKQTNSVSEYIEKFDTIVHQILAHDPKFNSATVTNRFIDGLRDDIRAVVLVHRPGNLDTASSIALLQEETSKDPPKREYKRNDYGSGFKYSNKYRSFPFSNSNNAQMAAKGSDGEPNPTKRSNDHNRSSQSEHKAATLMA